MSGGILRVLQANYNPSAFCSGIFSLLLRTLLFTFLVLGPDAAAEGAEPAALAEWDAAYRQNRSVQEFLDLERRMQDALKREPASEALAWRMGRVYFALGKRMTSDADKELYFSRCMEQCEEAIRSNAGSAPGYFFKGLCLGMRGQTRGLWASLMMIEPFRETMETALRLDPSVDRGGPHRALGRLYQDLPFFLGGDLDEAIGHFREAVRLAPDYAENHLFLARALLEQGRPQEAEHTLRPLFRIVPADASDPDDREMRQSGRKLMQRISSELKQQTVDAHNP